MSDQWYYSKKGQQIGPVTAAEISNLIRTWQLSAPDLIWCEGMPQWLPIQDVPEFRVFLGNPSPSPSPAHAPMPYSPIGYATRGSTPPPNYLVQAILVTICCCLPFGIVSIVFAAQVNGKFQAGDVQGAYNSSKTAKTWAWWGFGIGIAANVIVVGLQILAEMA